MEEPQEYDFTKLKNVESIQEFCNSHLFDIATDGVGYGNHYVKVRFIDQDGNFGYTRLGRFFFFYECMYIISKDEKYEPYHNPDILEISEELDILNYTGEFIVRVIFAGVFTGFFDDKGNRIFTGDVVSSRVLIDPTIPSNGGKNRARNLDNEQKGAFIEAGVDESSNSFSIILDNHSVPLSWATELEVVGSLFFDLATGETEVDIRSLCNSFAQSREDRKELKRLIKKSPYFPPQTWQEIAIELLCGDNNYDNKEKEIINTMENPWTEFQNNPKQDYLILEADKLVVDKFNETANEQFRIHTEIMPAPFMGNVLDAQVLLLLLNPGYDEEEDRRDYYKRYRHYWENEIQHKLSIPGLPLFCLDDSYINFSDYWQKKLKPLIRATSKEKVAQNVSLIQFFPYHTKKYKNIPKKISSDYLESQEYNFYLVRKAIERKATIIILRGKKLWFEAIPSLENYENLRFTNSYLNTILSKNNLNAFDEIAEKLNRKDKA